MAVTAAPLGRRLVSDADSILVVDDDDAIRSLLELRLRARDLSLASSVAEAIEVLERRSVDVIVSDYSMGSETGLNLLAYVRGRGLDTRFVLTSACLPDGVEVEARAAGADVIDKSDLVDLLAIRAQ